MSAFVKLVPVPMLPIVHFILASSGYKLDLTTFFSILVIATSRRLATD